MHHWHAASTNRDNRHILGPSFPNISRHVTFDHLHMNSLLWWVERRLKVWQPSHASQHRSGTVYQWHWAILIQFKLFENTFRRHIYTQKTNILLTKQLSLSVPSKSYIYIYIYIYMYIYIYIYISTYIYILILYMLRCSDPRVWRWVYNWTSEVWTDQCKMQLSNRHISEGFGSDGSNQLLSFRHPISPRQRLRGTLWWSQQSHIQTETA